MGSSHVPNPENTYPYITIQDEIWWEKFSNPTQSPYNLRSDMLVNLVKISKILTDGHVQLKNIMEKN